MTEIATDQALPDSLWASSAPPSPEAPPLSGDATAAVAIVGGGYTGLSAALHLAEAGVDAIVLEAAKVGFGGSGRNAGLVNAGLWLPPDDIEELLGQNRGRRLNDALAAAPDLVFSLIDKHGIACEATRVGTMHLAHAESGVADLARRAEQWGNRGAPVTLLNNKETEALTGSARFHGALLDKRAGTIQPLAYARGLAAAALKAGARLHAATPVRGLERDGEHWVLRTEAGEARAKQVILATNAYTGGLWPGLEQTMFPIHYFQLATKPLSDNLRESVLPEGHGTWDTAKVMRSVRKDARGRLILGSMGDLPDGDPGFLRGWADRMLGHLFPQLGRQEWEYAWAGSIAFTPDHLPRLYRLAPGLLTCIGYNGRGIGPGTVFGKALAELTQGAPDESFPLDLSEPRTIALRGMKSAAVDGGAKALHLVQRFI